MLRSLKILYAETAEYKMTHNRCDRKEFFNLSLGELIVLLSAHEGQGHVLPRTMADLSRVLWMNSASITGTVDTFEEFAMAIRVADTQDGRRKNLHLIAEYAVIIGRFMCNLEKEMEDPDAALEFELCPPAFNDEAELEIKTWAYGEGDVEEPEISEEVDPVTADLDAASAPKLEPEIPEIPDEEPEPVLELNTEPAGDLDEKDREFNAMMSEFLPEIEKV